MHGNLNDAESRSTKATPATGSELQITLISESDAWFFNAAHDLLGKDAGLGLHVLTSYPQSTCYAYVAKNPESRRPPPEHMLRTLIYPDTGEPWFWAFMAPCQAQWWLDIKHAVAIKRAIDGVGNGRASSCNAEG